MEPTLEPEERAAALSKEIDALIGRADAAIKETDDFLKEHRIGRDAGARYFERPEWEGKGKVALQVVTDGHAVEFAADASRLERRAGQSGSGKAKKQRLSI
jgi:hypothetical protein